MARPPILLIHGALCRGGHFAGWARALTKAGFECHTPSLPGHEPSDPVALTRLTFGDYLAALQRLASALPAPPVIIGHSMGGLLAQHLAAAMPCAALVCVASVAPWPLIPPMRSLPLLAPILPAILAGRPFHLDEAAVRTLALGGLGEEEQRQLLPTFGAESGRAFRTLIFGLAPISGRRFQGPVLCLSGFEDRLVSNRISHGLASYYSAQHEIFPKRGHWLIASSAEDEVLGKVLGWLEQQLVDR